MKQKQQMEEGRTVKLTMKNYTWLTKQSKVYGQSLDQIFSEVVAELEELRHKTSKTK